MSHDDTPARVRWARLRFSIIGPLLASPSVSGELGEHIIELSRRSWRHPTTGEAVCFSAKTIERWYYAARSEADPVRALERKVPKHAGTHPSVSPVVAAALTQQHAEHPCWSYQLHHDNLCALARQELSLGKPPGYATVCRFMKAQGLTKQKRQTLTERGEAIVQHEVRSFEVEHVNGLWHLDFHEGSLRVLHPSGQWVKPVMFGALDDASRLCCHGQWYYKESAQTLTHGLSQGFQKRGLPRGLLDDNGGAMLAAETKEGLFRLGIVNFNTMPRTPRQNGKQESFWGPVEGRLLAMLEGVEGLTLGMLNQATQAWIEQEYHRSIHSELKETPLERYLRGPNVGRPCPSSEELRRAFRMEVTRTQRSSDGTVTVCGVRFEVPSAYRTLKLLRLRVARWDLSNIELVDPRTGALLATLLPLDKAKNADRVRRALAQPASPPSLMPRRTGIAPHLRALMAEYAATGLPPAYLALDDSGDDGIPENSAAHAAEASAPSHEPMEDPS
jgi:transposase InsO family protein